MMSNDTDRSSRVRAPAPPLRRFVSMFWACRARPVSSPLERMLPCGAAHLAVRTDDAPIRLAAGRDDAMVSLGSAALCGPRSVAYVKDASQSSGSVGVQFRPGGLRLFCGEPAHAFAERHVALTEMLGRAEGDLIHRIRAETDLDRQIDVLESFLLHRLPLVHGVHPAVAAALSQFDETDDVGQVVRAIGCSHRHFVAMFRREVGLAPKQYCRVIRFRRAVTHLTGGVPLIDTAMRAGFADQPHFTREFRRFAGITPGEYLASNPRREDHVPVREGQFRSRRSPRRRVRCGP